jgi:glycerophosphoryl diester phosphodiesterase
MSMIVGHRGLRLQYPDNTVEGIVAAGAICDMVEIDLRRTKDGIAVLAHDPTFGGSPIIESDWEALAGLDLGGGLHPARFDDVLESADGIPLNLEIKNSPLDPDFDATFEFARTVAGRATRGDVVTSFHWPTVDAVLEAHPDVQTGLLIDPTGTLSGAANWATARGHRVLAPHWSLLSDHPAKTVAELTDAGFEVFVWTVNDDDMARRVAEGGAAAIITDDPGRIRAAVYGKEPE